jgi:hypothetical protein
MKRLIFAAYFSENIASTYPSLINCLMVSAEYNEFYLKCHHRYYFFLLSWGTFISNILFIRSSYISILHYGGCFGFRHAFKLGQYILLSIRISYPIDCFKCYIRSKIYIMRYNDCYFLITISLVVQ